MNDRRSDSGARPKWRGRGLHWLPALVLFVLLASAVMPASAGGALGEQRIEVVVGGDEVHAHGGVVGRERHVSLPSVATGVDVPRPQPRTRSVAARGLPPARAPTA